MACNVHFGSGHTAVYSVRLRRDALFVPYKYNTPRDGTVHDILGQPPRCTARLNTLEVLNTSDSEHKSVLSVSALGYEQYYAQAIRK